MNKLDIDELFRRIDFGVKRGAAMALEEHKKSNRSIVIWRDGHVVKIPPEEIEIPKEYLKSYE